MNDMEEDKKYMKVIGGEVRKGWEGDKGMGESVGMMNMKRGKERIVEGWLLGRGGGVWERFW